MTIEIEYEARQTTELPYREIIQKVIEAALDDIECPFEAEISVLLTDNDKIRRMNQEFRQIDRATDVLSFPLRLPVPVIFPMRKKNMRTALIRRAAS